MHQQIPDEVNATARPELFTDLGELGDRPIRIRFFANRYDWMGPAIVVLSSWYFAAQVLVAWVFRPQYSFVANTISDLGNTACPPPHSGICSPRYWVMDASIAILGVAMIVGSVLIFSEFRLSYERRERAAAIAGFVFLGYGGLGAVLVGLVPENIDTAHLHTVGTAMAIGFGQLAILILGLVLREIDDWLREFMLVTSLFVLLAGICIAGKHQFGIGAGALERLAEYPESAWLILFGFYISRDHYRRGVIGSRFKFSRPPRPAQLLVMTRLAQKSTPFRQGPGVLANPDLMSDSAGRLEQPPLQVSNVPGGELPAADEPVAQPPVQGAGGQAGAVIRPHTTRQTGQSVPPQEVYPLGRVLSKSVRPLKSRPTVAR